MRPAALAAALALLVALAFLFNLSAGKVFIPPFGLAAGSADALIMAELRLPRALLALGIGAMLGAAGAALQGWLRNPLADPAVLGISASAALGSVLAIFLGAAATPAIVSAAGMAGAVVAMALLLLLVGGGASTTMFILAGVILSTLAGSLMALLISLAPTPFALGEIVTWSMGALTDRTMADAARALPFIALGLALLMPAARALDALSLGEETARSLGVRIGRMQALIMLGTGLGVGAGVAVSGVVGFVGLIVPHLLRPLAGEQPSAIILPSALGGAALLLTADALVRLVPGAQELKLGIAMALIGAPFFLLLLWRHRGRIG